MASPVDIDRKARTLEIQESQTKASKESERRALNSRIWRLETDALAQSRFQDLGLATQLRLIHETVLSRQSELTLAYRNVVRVSSGFRRQRSGQEGGGVLTQEPCVVFTVRTKWASRRNSAQALPRHLLAFATQGGQRIQVAIPTDVQLETCIDRSRPQTSATAIRVKGGGETGFGAVTCMVEVTSPAGVRRMLMSALHVLSITANDQALPKVGAALRQNAGAGGDRWGISEAIGGCFSTSTGDAFDVQLASVPTTPPPSLSKALTGLPWDMDEPSIPNFSRLCELVASAAPIHIAVPSNHPDFDGGTRPNMPARLSGLGEPGAPIPYRFRADGVIGDFALHHRELLEFEPLGQAATLPGDSGCAVICWLDEFRCSLVGMHIAANEDSRISYVIPAWQLLKIENYAGTLPESATVRPVVF